MFPLKSLLTLALLVAAADAARAAPRPDRVKAPSEPAAARAAALARLGDPAAVVRFEALRTLLDLGPIAPGEVEPLRHDPSRSVLELLLSPWTGREERAHALRDVLAVRARTFFGGPPAEESAYAVRSTEILLDSGLMLEVAASSREIDAREPLLLLAPPVWVRVELRNPGATELSLRFDRTTGLPWIGWELVGPGVEAMVPSGGSHAFETRTLAPGARLDYVFHLFEWFWPTRSGTYELRAGPPSQSLLRFEVSGRPDPLPRPERPTVRGSASWPMGPLLAPERPIPAAEAALARFLVGGAEDDLVTLTHVWTVDEIDRRLQQAPAEPLPSVARVRLSRSIGAGWTWSGAQSAMAENGSLHVAYRSQGGAIVHVKWRPGRDPVEELVPRGKLELHPVSLVAGRGGSLLLLSRSTSPFPHPVTGLPPAGRERIVLSRRPPEGRWTQPELVPTEPLFYQGLSATLDPDGALHVVWSSWHENTRPQTLHHLARGPDGWSDRDDLPASPEAEFWRPMLLAEGDRLTVIVTAQDAVARTGRPAWLWRDSAGWRGPLDIPAPPYLMDLLAGPAKAGVLLLTEHWDGRRPRVALQHLDRDGCRAPILELPSELRESGNGIETQARIAVDESGRPFLFLTSGRDLFLAREGGVASLLDRGEEHRSIHGLHLKDGRFHALLSIQRRGQLELVHGPLPSEREWAAHDPIDRLFVRLARGAGLEQAVRDRLRRLVGAEAEGLAREGRLAEALERYLYVAAGFEPGNALEVADLDAAIERLFRTGGEAVRAAAWLEVGRRPGVLWRSAPLIRELTASPTVSVR